MTDLVDVLVSIMTQKNQYSSAGIETAQLEAAELILGQVPSSDARAEQALGFLRAIAEGGSSAGITPRLRAVKVLLAYDVTRRLIPKEKR